LAPKIMRTMTKMTINSGMPIPPNIFSSLSTVFLLFSLCGRKDHVPLSVPKDSGCFFSDKLFRQRRTDPFRSKKMAEKKRSGSSDEKPKFNGRIIGSLCQHSLGTPPPPVFCRLYELIPMGPTWSKRGFDHGTGDRNGLKGLGLRFRNPRIQNPERRSFLGEPIFRLKGVEPLARRF
jgi:hypothetical protein